MSRPPTISIVVPIYNGARFLPALLNSLLEQTEAVSEVIVVDDGSTDDGAAIAEAHPLPVRVIRQPNRGVAYARNAGALAATGSFIALVDQDDLWAPRRHARLLRLLASQPDCRALVTSCTDFVDAGDTARLAAIGEQLHRKALTVDSHRPLDAQVALDDDGSVPPVIRVLEVDELLAGPPSVTASYVIDRELFLSAGGCAPFARSFDDYVGLLQLSISTAIHYVDEPSLLYRVHPQSTTMSTDWSLPLLVGIAAVRHSGNVVPPGRARNTDSVPLLFDERRFFAHQLLALAGRSNQGALDALAVARLLGTGTDDRRHAYRSIVMRRAKSMLGDARRRWSAPR